MAKTVGGASNKQCRILTLVYGALRRMVIADNHFPARFTEPALNNRKMTLTALVSVDEFQRNG